ncbi:SusD/RagB family nutrient-binding outer membrane lipoprotein [Hymenobacter humi]|uniref:SusD/RagB family nutrient-binding outer membrane lipoprotein n=1 Tax=Hymenobacter humi TaxID=1411620 RepID=A0ABW2U437_9BACT
MASLREGIRAHMKKVSAGGSFSPPAVTFPVITDAQITAYLNSAAVPQTAADVTLRSIMEQKYIAMFMNPEAWTDLRRLDYDPLIYVNYEYPRYPSGNGPLQGRYPRLLPGATEVTVNPNAVAALYAEAGATTDADYITKPLWFDMP